MAAVLHAMTGGLAAAEMREREGAGESLLRNRETAQQLELALTQSRSERASGLMNQLNVYIQRIRTNQGVSANAKIGVSCGRTAKREKRVFLPG